MILVDRTDEFLAISASSDLTSVNTGCRSRHIALTQEYCFSQKNNSFAAGQTQHFFNLCNFYTILETREFYQLILQRPQLCI